MYFEFPGKETAFIPEDAPLNSFTLTDSLNTTARERSCKSNWEERKRLTRWRMDLQTDESTIICCRSAAGEMEGGMGRITII